MHLAALGYSDIAKLGVACKQYCVDDIFRLRKSKAGCVPRISAPDVEGTVEIALRKQLPDHVVSRETIADFVERVTVKKNSVVIAIVPGILSTDSIEIPWTRLVSNGGPVPPTLSNRKPDQKLLQSIARAHAWIKDFSSGRYTCVEDLAHAASLHPKVVRQGLRLAFLSPELTSAILAGDRALELKQIPKLLPISWREQERVLG